MSIIAARTKVLFLSLSFLVLGLLAVSINAPEASADCGADGVGPHGYAGAVIDIVILKPDGSTKVEAKGVFVTVQTAESTQSSAGNIKDVTRPESQGRYLTANFSQIPAGTCAGNNVGSNAVVLGYGTTSQPTNPSTGQVTDNGQWALDCDISKRGIDNPQPFDVWISGDAVPSNAQPGGSWNFTQANKKRIAPKNGTTAKFELVYSEPSPPPGKDSSNIISVSDDCRSITYYLNSNDNNNNVTFRIFYSMDGVNSTQVGGWTYTEGAKTTNLSSIGLTTHPQSYFIRISDDGGNTFRPGGTQRPDGTFNEENYRPPRAGQLCNTPPPQPVSFDVVSFCGGFTISNLNDPDSPSVVNRVHSYEVYDDGSRNGAPLFTGSFTTNSANNANVPFPSRYRDVDNVNNGIYVVVKVDDYDTTSSYRGTTIRGDDSEDNCFKGTCSINSITKKNPSTPDVTGGNAYAVVGGATYTITARITNNGISTEIPRSQFSATYYNQSGTPVFNTSQGTGSIANPAYFGSQNYVDVTFDITAPDIVTSIPIYADYAGKFPLHDPQTTGCRLNVYKPYDITPTNQGVSLNPDAETPTSATLASGISNSGQAVNNVTVTRSIERKIGANITVLPNNLVSTYNNIGSNNDPHTVNIPQPVDSSQEYCGIITVSPAAGWVGPNNHRTVTVDARSAGPSCDSVDNLPYMKVYGGDVVSGAATLDSTSGSCVSPAQGGIAAFMRPATENAAAGKSGSGSQYATFSYGGTTNGFASAMLRGTAPAASGVNKLTFANTASPIGAGLSPELGPQFNGSRPCLDDYFTKGQYPNTNDSSSVISESNVTSLSLSGLAFNKQTLISYPDAGVSADVTLSSGEGYASRHTVFVDGDARISTNIVYAADTATSTTTGDVRDRPSFTLIVRGNIYIDPGVSRLDGTYIAQKRVGSATDTGKIYTCAPNGAAITSSDLTQRFSACGANGGVPQLRVYGSFVADQLVLGRTMGSVRDSGFQENQDVTRAAEVFIFMPDYYISKPVVRPAGTITSGDYEYLAKLPPIL